MTKRWLLWIVFVAFIVRVAVWAFFALHFETLVTWRLPDDALYYFAIAKNIANGHGISFDGVHPTNGMHPLWLFSITPISFLGLSKLAAINAILLVQSLLDVLVVWLIGDVVYNSLWQSSEPNRRYAAGVAALLYALSPFALMRGINGLETTLTALFLILWLRTYLYAIKDGRFIVLGIVTGFLLLARTDSFLVILPLIICSLWARKIEVGQAIITAGIAGIIVAPWLIWNYVTFGSILQSSAQAVPIMAMRKYNVIYGPSLKYVYLFIDAIKNGLKPFWYSTCGIALLTIGYSLSVQRKSLTASYREALWLAAGCILLLGIHSFFRGFIRDWYVEETLPLFLVAYGMSIATNAAHTKLSAGVWRLATLILIVQLWMNRQPMYASQRIVFNQGLPIVQELSQHSNIGSLNSGYYGYFVDRTGSIVNLDGVVNHDAVVAIKNNDLRDLLTRDSVGYIVEFEGDFGGYLNLIDHHMLEDYSVERSFPAGETKLLVLRRK